jgi:hypothetical protein
VFALLVATTSVAPWLQTSQVVQAASAVGLGHAGVAPLVSAANDNDGNGNGNNNGNSNNNGNDNGNDNSGGASIAPASPAAASDANSANVCASAGAETAVSPLGGRVTVRLFSTLPRAIRVIIRENVDPSTVPAAPGQRVGALVFQVNAEECAGGAVGAFPVEVNLGVRYTDQEATGLNEAGFAIAVLDPATRQWRPLAKQANDPANNFVSATITETGTFVVYQR